MPWTPWFYGVVGLFCLERWHQWLSLLNPPTLGLAPADTLRPRTVLLLALVIGFGEALGFYVDPERGDLLFWKVVLWTMVAHAIVSWCQWRRTARRAAGGGGGAISATGDILLATGTFALVVFRAARFEPADVILTWFGWTGLSPLTPAVEWGIPAAAIMLGFVAALAEMRRSGWHRGRDLLLFAPLAALIAQALAQPGPWAILAALLVGHALPSLWITARWIAPGRRVGRVALAFLAALVEWWLASRSIWFPAGSVFPDLMDWWDLGVHAGFFLHPIWMMPFLAHILLDLARFQRTEDPCPSR